MISIAYLQPSMVLLQINVQRVSIAPFECDAPRTVDVKAVALRLTPERMEIEAGDIEVAQRRRVFERVQPPEHPASEFPRHLTASTLPKKLLKPLVPEAPNHRSSVTSRSTAVNEYVTEKKVGRLVNSPRRRVLRRARDACKR
jgi:hypothetical protein